MAAIQFRKISVQSLSSDFRSATRIEPCEVDPDTLAEEDLLIRVEYVGINASDSNFSAGKYTPGVEPPFDCGFEAVGVVVGCGPTSADKAFLGRSVAVAGFGCFAEFLVVSRSSVLPIGEKPEPTSLAILVSGLTASISIAHTLGVGKRCREILSEGKTPSAIITAAAGGTGQFAVQLLRLWGCKTAGTCSTSAKERELSSLGCEPINYRSSDFHAAARSWGPCGTRGVDFVYESVGGSMFDDCVDLLRKGGRLCVIGFISGYRTGEGWSRSGQSKPAASVGAGSGAAGARGHTPKQLKTPSSGTSLAAAGTSGPARASRPPWPVQLLAKSASVRGFFLNHFAREQRRHIAGLLGLVRAGLLQVQARVHPRVGLEGVPAAVEHMLGAAGTEEQTSAAWAVSGGKLCVHVQPPLSPAARRALAALATRPGSGDGPLCLPASDMQHGFRASTQPGRVCVDGRVPSDDELKGPRREEVRAALAVLEPREGRAKL